MQVDKNLLDALIDTETLYQEAPCGYVSLLPDGTIIKLNNTLLTWLNYTTKSLLYKKKFSDLLSKGGKVHFEMFFKPMITVRGHIKELSYEILKKDGSVLPVLLSAKAMKDALGSVMAINMAVYDITDRKSYEVELLKAKKTAEDEKRTFQFLADLIPEMIWTANADGDIDYVNQRFVQYFNLPERNFNLSSVASRIFKEDRKKFLNAWRESIRAGTDLHIEIRLDNYQGNSEWHLIKAVPYINQDGLVTKWFGSCISTEEHIMALKAKDDFISIASHELKTPITSLKGTLQLMDKIKNNHPDPLLHKMIDRANRNVNKTISLIDDLLNVSRINEGQLYLNKKRSVIFDLINDCCSHIKYETGYDILIEGDSSIEADIDEGRIEQVIINFINNAIKYAPESKLIEVGYEKNGQHVKIEVTDKGPGISPEKLFHLFERYYQVKNNSSGNAGLGLGLYICAEIIKKHNGKIGVKSELGKGSTFWFTLPANM
nr:PAS domain-containing sensor histidine kinase [Mucilaginibacter lappiensis]